MTPPQTPPRSGEGLSDSPFPRREGGWGVRFSEFANSIILFADYIDRGVPAILTKTITKLEIDMEYNSYLQSCGDDGVISFSSQIYKIGKIKQALDQAFGGQVPNALMESLESQGIKEARIYQFPSRGRAYEVNSYWFDEGKDCEILRIGSNGWQKGKLRIKVSLEFCPDEPEISEPESPLDDLRQMINQETQQ